MSTNPPAPSRTLPALLLLATAVWSVSNLIALVDEVKFFDRLDGAGPPNYRLYLALWIVASLIALLAIAPAIISMSRPRAAHWVAALAVGATLLSFGTTLAVNLQYNEEYVLRGLRIAYIEGLRGDYGWKQVNAALSFWLVVPVLVIWLVWATSRATSRAAATPTAPTPTQSMPVAPADEWYVMTAGTAYGPYTWRQLMAYGEEGRVTPDTLVRRGHEPVVPLSMLLRR